MVNQLAEIRLPAMSPAANADGRPVRDVSRLDSFLAGPENQLVLAAAQRILPATHGACHAPPAVIVFWGPTGTGKSHLARGICQLWQQSSGELSTAEYLTAADFRHQLQEAINQRTVDRYRQRLRSLELLVLDDLHRLPAESYLNEELIHTFDSLEENGSQLIATSTKPPRSLGNLSPAMVDRLTTGLALPVATPGPEARAEFAARFADSLGEPISQQTAARLADRVTGNLNEIAGVLTELMQSDRAGPALSPDDVDCFLNDRSQARRPQLADILRVVAKYYSIPQKVLRGGSRRQSVVVARAMAIYLARELAGMSYQQIGKGLGGRDHTTVMHSYRKTISLAEHNLATQQAIKDLERLLVVP